MEIRFIAFGMVILLVLLFAGANFYIPRAKAKSKWEAQYALAALEYFKNSTQDNYLQCKQALENLYGANNPKVLSKLEKDKIQSPS